jgi:plasmid stabilization system protein ParE
LAQLSFTAGALADVGRLTDFLIEADAVAAMQATEFIIEAIEILANHPLIGRRAEQDLRELVISRGHSGYVALYSYEAPHDTVLILAIRHQRETGYFDLGE